VPTETHPATDPKNHVLSTVRQGQAAVIDSIRAWTVVTEQLTRTLRVPVPRVDLAGIVDRVFDVAEQTLAAQRQLAHALTGVATRQADTAVTAVEATEAALEQPQAPAVDAPPEQDRRPDGRTYEERSVEELRERAGELEIEGRSSMTKDELIAALRNHRKSRSARSRQSR
jgi:sRNA-binding protein